MYTFFQCIISVGYQLVIRAYIQYINEHFSDLKLHRKCANFIIVFSKNEKKCFFFLNSIRLTFSPTNGRDHVNTSMKFGSQYGCVEQLNCLIFITLFSYFNTAACVCGWEYNFQIKIYQFIEHFEVFNSFYLIIVHIQIIWGRKDCY